MDNATKGFAQNIISEIKRIRVLIENPVSVPSDEHKRGDSHQSEANQRDDQATPARSEPRPSIEHTPTTYQKYTKHLRELKPWMEALGIIVLIVYTIFAGFQSSEMREANRIAVRTFNSVNRPFIGVERTGVLFYGTGPGGRPTPAEESSLRNARNMRLNAIIKNFGSISGTNFKANMDIFINGLTVTPAYHVPDLPFTLFPGEVISLGDAQMGSVFTPLIVAGKSTLVLEVTIDYDGPSAHYHQCDKYQYVTDATSFLSLGPLCGKR